MLRFTADASAKRAVFRIPPIILFVALAEVVATAAQELPDGAGRDLVSTRCASCHSLERVVESRHDHEGWTSLVAKMVRNGARLDERERDTAIAYLSAHFGPPPAAADQKDAAAEDPAVERTAQRYITGICSSCHDTALITSTRATPAEWREIVDDMNGKGAGLSEADVDLLAGYLARRFPAD